MAKSRMDFVVFLRLTVSSAAITISRSAVPRNELLGRPPNTPRGSRGFPKSSSPNSMSDRSFEELKASVYPKPPVNNVCRHLAGPIDMPSQTSNTTVDLPSASPLALDKLHHNAVRSKEADKFVASLRFQRLNPARTTSDPA